VFGDWHHYAETCSDFSRNSSRLVETIDVEDLLEDAVQLRTDVPVDLFVEDWYFKDDAVKRGSKSTEARGYLFVETVNRFQDCLWVDKRACKHKNLRAHYVDARSLIGLQGAVDPIAHPEAGRFLAAIRFVHGVSSALNAYEAGRVTWEQIRNAEWSIANFPTARDLEDPWNFQRLVMGQLVVVGKGSKQIDRIEDPRVREQVRLKLAELFETEAYRIDFAKMMDHLAGLYRWIRLPEEIANPKGLPGRKVRAVIDEIGTWNVMGFAMLMDAYLIGRLLKRMDPPIRNAIVYVGDAHAHVVREVLKSLNYAEIHFPAVGHQCIDVTAMRFPIFDRNFYDLPEISANERIRKVT
jgi:hypothetical protein